MRKCPVPGGRFRTPGRLVVQTTMSSHRSLWLGEGLGSTLCFCELAKLAFAQGPLTRIQICSSPLTAASAIHPEMQALFLSCGWSLWLFPAMDSNVSVERLE